MRRPGRGNAPRLPSASLASSLSLQRNNPTNAKNHRLVGGSLRRPALPSLRAAGSPWPRFARRRAVCGAAALARLPAPDVVPTLRAALDDPQEIVRDNARAALQGIDDSAAKAALQARSERGASALARIDPHLLA